MRPYYLYSGMPEMQKHKTAAVIDGEALAHNFRLLSSLMPSTRHICVVKADAYGHTADICVRRLLLEGCDFFAVSCIEEALSVREICREEKKDAEILILGYTDCEQAALLASDDIIQAVLDEDYALCLNRYAAAEHCRVRAHIALDTGMNRIGLLAMSDSECDIAAQTIKRINSLDNLKVEGIFTHFSKSDEEYSAAISADSRTRLQASRFLRVRKSVEDNGMRLFCHVCNSAATIRFPEYAFDGVRLGIMLYGVYPSEFIKDMGLRPVMMLKSVISHIHDAPAGEGVSYGGEFVSDIGRSIATIPIGYADGFIRAYSGAAVRIVTESGEFTAPVVGRICMDQCMVDVTDIPAKAGDSVILFGYDSDQLQDLAKRANTIDYECLCLVSARVPRIKK